MREKSASCFYTRDDLYMCEIHVSVASWAIFELVLIFHLGINIVHVIGSLQFSISYFGVLSKFQLVYKDFPYGMWKRNAILGGLTKFCTCVLSDR